MGELNKQQIKSLVYARHLADISEPIKGTLAETYLKVERGIDLDLDNQNIRFIPSVREPDSQIHHPGLLVIGRTKEGEVSGVQVVYLDDNGKKLNCETPKRSYGFIKNAAVPVQCGSSIMAVAEGVETALSVAKAHPEITVFASLGSITNVSAIDFHAKGNTMVICADNDENNHDTELKSSRAADEFQKKGFNVLITKPEKMGHDFNDVLKENGLDALKNELAKIKVYRSQDELKTINEAISENRARTKELEDTKKHAKEQELDF
jgi:phage/plasmid primase-like uncharacterized protein